MDDPRLYRLIKLLEKHDWLAEYSDDIVRRYKGEENMMVIEDEINSLMQEGRGDDAMDMWYLYCPWSKITVKY